MSRAPIPMATRCWSDRTGRSILGPLTMAKPAYQWEQAFAPVSSLAVATNLLLVRPSLPVKSVKELVDYAKNNPNKLTLATSSVASINHFLGELFKLKAGITWTEVHYRGNSLAINDLIAGLMSTSASSSLSTPRNICRAASCAPWRCRARRALPPSRTCRRWRTRDIPR